MKYVRFLFEFLFTLFLMRLMDSYILHQEYREVQGLIIASTTAIGNLIIRESEGKK
jgi:hypothetical protein